MRDRMMIPKLFYATPLMYADWPYQDRRAVGYHLDRSWSRHQSIYRFEHRGIIYEISREKAQRIGRRFTVPGGVCPHLLPIAEMDRIIDTNPPKKADANPEKPAERQGGLF